MFPGRIADDRTSDFLFGPPAYTLFTANYTTISGLRSAPKNYSPNSVLSAERDYHLPSTYSWSLGVQKDIGFGTVLDIAYVGSVTRHTLLYQSLNATPYGTNFLPTSQDTTVTGNKPLPINFLRPIVGYGDIQYYSFSGSSNYHSMQTQLNRRLKQDLLFGVAWTYSKSLDYTDGANTLNPFFNPRTRSYGKAGFDRTHALATSFSYRLPKVPGSLSNPVTRTALDNWEVAGIVSFLSGPPMGISYSLASGADLTGNGGAGVDSRVVLTCNPNLPNGERTMLRAFRTECVQPPIAAGDFGRGNAPKDVFRGPGINNWNLSLVKNFPFGKDTNRRVQFRAEMYNAFNHAQFTSVDTGARFDALGNQINGRFGQYTAAADGRRIQLALKFYF
jgi:hypothetical protein